jgi:hypothetical protein
MRDKPGNAVNIVKRRAPCLKIGLPKGDILYLKYLPWEAKPE